MQQLSSFFLLILLTGTAVVAGCTQGPGTVPAVTPVPGTLPHLQDLALNTADLPPCFSLTEHNVKGYGDVGQLAKDLGWQAGYEAVYTCSAEGSDPTVLVHSLAVYPENTLPGIASMADEQDRSQGFLYENLSFPDQAIPMRGFYGKPEGTQDAGVRSSVTGGVGDTQKSIGNGSNVTEIIFYQGTIFEVLKMTGPGTNATLLRDLAQRAAAKTV
jgi:hypothetical protein